MAALLTPSPCIGACRLDPTAQLCTGCARSGAEITAWKDASPADRAQTWADLPARRARLGIGLHRLGWLPDQILDFVQQTLHSDHGSWTVETVDDLARFTLPAATVERQGSAITATSGSASIHFTIHDRVRVLALPSVAGRGERIILAVPRSQSSPAPAIGQTPLRAGLAPESAGWVVMNPVARVELPGSIRPRSQHPAAGAGFDVPESFLACATFEPG